MHLEGGDEEDFDGREDAVDAVQVSAVPCVVVVGEMTLVGL